MKITSLRVSALMFKQNQLWGPMPRLLSMIFHAIIKSYLRIISCALFNRHHALIFLQDYDTIRFCMSSCVPTFLHYSSTIIFFFLFKTTKTTTWFEWIINQRLSHFMELFHEQPYDHHHVDKASCVSVDLSVHSIVI